MQSALGQGAPSFQRVDAQRPGNKPLKHCLTRKGARSCHGAAAKPDKTAQAPQPPEFPGAGTGSGPAAGTDVLPLPNSPPPGRGNTNHRVERSAGEPQSGGPTPGFKFTGGMGVPTNRATLEGSSSPYQLPNGNTSASQSGKITNGLETQGAHFGFEFHY